MFVTSTAPPITGVRIRWPRFARSGVYSRANRGVSGVLSNRPAAGEAGQLRRAAHPLTVQSLDRNYQHTVGIDHRDGGIALPRPEGRMPVLDHRTQMAHVSGFPPVTPRRHRQGTECGQPLKTVDRPDTDPIGQSRGLGRVPPGPPTLEVADHWLQLTVTMSDLSRRLLRMLPRLLNTPVTKLVTPLTSPTLLRRPVKKLVITILNRSFRQHIGE